MRKVDLRGALIKVRALSPRMAAARLLAAICAVGVIAVMMPSATEDAVANGDTRTIHFFHTHTGETIDATFRVDGHYDAAVLRQLNHFLRDWRNDDETNMDPRLFDAVWESYRSAGATDRIQIYSAYRSPETNAMLRRRSRAVAEHSQHMLGKAMDTTLPGFPMAQVRDAGMKLQRGGVGWYPSANFVHLDVGGVRSWPRMPYEQLARLFPDGKTVHIPANGQPLPGYEAARQEIAARGGTDLPPAQESGGFFAWLFGGGNNNIVGAAREDEEDRRTAVAVAAPPPVQRRRVPEPVAQPEPVAVAQAAPQPEPVQPAQVQQQAERQQQAETRQGAPLAYAADPQQLDLKPKGRGEQIASLDVPADRSPVLAVMPMPPRRPAELAMIVPEIPLPPVRPDALMRMQSASIRFSETAVPVPMPSSRPDAIAGLITATASGVPMIRKSRLPAIITQGDGHKTLPHHAMSFAETESLVDPTPEPVKAKPVSLRAAAQRVAARTTGASAPPATAPNLTGLRKAAKLMAQRASL